jgi:hypothetical protein
MLRNEEFGIAKKEIISADQGSEKVPCPLINKL